MSDLAILRRESSSVASFYPCRAGRGAVWTRGGGRQAGAMLIIALGVLTLLAVLGATFAQLMRLERQASDNNVDSQRMDWVVTSALDKAVAQFHTASNHYSWTSWTATDWMFRYGKEGVLAHGRFDVEDSRVGKWENYMEVGGFLYRFKTKVIDTNAQINLNGRQDTLARMLDNLGKAIAGSTRLKREGKRITNPFYTGPNRSGNLVRGEDILLFRQRLEGQRFQSKNQLRQLIGDENFEIVQDFITCHSWEDPYTYRADDGANEVPDLALGRSGVEQIASGGGGGGLGGGGVTAMDTVVGAPRMSPEPRHPINLNTAPEEVLIACFAGIAGRRIFPYSKLDVGGGAVAPIDQGATILGERVLGNEEVRDVTPRPVFVYTEPISIDQARKFAERIVADRKSGGRALRTWRSNDSARPGFEDFIDTLDASFFPAPNLVQVIDPEQPNNRQIRSHIVSGGGSPLGQMWQRGTGQGAERQLRGRLGLPFHDQNAWYYDLIKGVIKANFNPNTRISRYNANVPVATVLDKSDLVWADRAGGTVPVLKKGHTTEFCFDAMGTFEVTALGEMLDLSKVSPSGARTVVAGRKIDDNALLDYFPFRRKIRSIVKVWDVLRHTNQLHFEQAFNVGAKSSKNDRKYVVTWPEPMNALTELYTQGSRRDGRVELAGLLDGRRQLSSFSTRETLFSGADQTIRAEHSFSERSSQNVSQLRRALQGKGLSLFGDEVSNALKGVFDFNKSVYRSTYKEFYRLSRMQAIGAFRGNVSGQWADPVVNKEEIGTDLFPDGFNTSILRMQHNGNRLLVLPARSRIGETTGGGDPRIGASGLGTRSQNDLGNVPYYSGGLAFWVKFEFDARDPVFSGLIGCTQVIREVRPAAQDFTGSEGTQFFIFKNTSGQLRVVRMYYHQAFLEGTSSGGGGDAGVARLFPDPGVENSVSGQSPDNPILENLDPQKIVSRSDLVVDIRHFKAHEWHHIALDWADNNQSQPIRLWIDFEPVEQGGIPQKAQQIVDGTANSWVRLNEEQPKDGLQVGGIVRVQGVADAGVFKWYTNTTRTATGGGVQPVAPSVKRILGNATIDEMIVYVGSFASVKRHYGNVGGAGYFTLRPGEYANMFSIPLPPEVNSAVLRSFDWTSYYPTTFTDADPGSVPRQLKTDFIECELWYRSGGEASPSRFSEPWRTPQVVSRIAGRRAYRKASAGQKGAGAEFVYDFTLPGGRSPSGGGVVQTTVLDDVTLSYYLPNPKILLMEDAD